MSKIAGLFYLSLLTVSLMSISIFAGNGQISSLAFLHAFWTSDHSLAWAIVHRIRIPNTVTAFVIGGLLGLAGSLMQVLLRNPLADPYVLGVSGGAAFVTLVFMTLGITGYGLTCGGLFGSGLAIFLIFALTKKKHHTNHLLLTGIAIATGFSAAISLLLLVSADDSIRGLLFWLVGDIQNYQLPIFASIILLGGLLVSLFWARDLNLFMRGEDFAKSLGVNTSQLQFKLLLLTSLLTAVAVTTAGCIGFIGLIVPHLYRLMQGNDQRFLLPGSTLIGGLLLVVANLIAHHLFMPLEIPVGIIMTLIGIPIFLFLLQKPQA